MNDIYININKGAEIKGLKSTRCHWVEYVHETDYCDMNLIKQACKGKQKTSYGYHWEFVEDEINKNA